MLNATFAVEILMLIPMYMKILLILIAKTVGHKYRCFIGTQEEFTKIQNARLITYEEIEAWYPQTFSEKIDTILLGYSKLSKYNGSLIDINSEQMYSAYFVKRYNSDGSELSEDERYMQAKFFNEYLQENKFITGVTGSIKLLPNAFKRIDTLQKNQSNSKNVFVAMSFADDMKNTRIAIRKAIENAGYIPIIMDEVEHNKQIVPEMLYQIKQSKFVVAEFTGHNNGAYYEAGYAAGLGKEVIHICEEKAFGTDGHFDIKQKATILWKTEAELTEKLCKRIKATIEY